MTLASGLYYQDPQPHLVQNFPELNPSQAFHNSVKLDYRLRRRWYITAEGYLKDYRNLVVFDVFQNYTNLGEGRSQGVEFKLEYRRPHLKLRGTYALSKADRIRNLQDQIYPFYFDQRHQANANLVFHPFLDRWWVTTLIQTDWRFSTGRPVSLPASIAVTGTGQMAFFYDEVNNARLGNSHSLNLRLEWERTFRKASYARLSWYVSAWNVYGQPNPLAIEFNLDPFNNNVSIDPQEAIPFFFDVGLSFQWMQRPGRREE